jgi:peptidoglycan hydrolase-like protein with peptidoglycan-binding domain
VSGRVLDIASDPEPATVELPSHQPDSPAQSPPARSPIGRRGRWLLLVVLLAVAASAGGLAATVLVKSPAERAADTAPPPRSVVAEKVTSRVLASTVVMRGQFANGRVFKFSPSAPAATAGGPGGSAMVVTGVHTSAGATVKAGRVLVEISGRPVFALAGAFPAYRDMLPGESGKDIRQLQDALARLGYRRGGDDDGEFGTGTAHAIREFYHDLGYPVPETEVQPEQPAAQPSGAPAGSPPATSAQPQKQPMMPMSEVVFLPTLPARVATFGASVGDTAGNPLITFTTGGPRLTGKLDPASRQLVKPGMSVKVADEVTGYSGTGRVASIGAQVSADGAEYLPLRIDGDEPWPIGEAGKDVRLTITAAATEGKVLAVPEAALTADAAGNTTVVVVDRGAQRVVVVTVGVSAGGMVEVAPAPGQRLAAGDEVVTGR